MTVTISGSGFVAGATVSIGGVAATGVAVASASSITAATPAHAAGAVDIAVTNPDGQVGRLANGFTYQTPVIPPPTMSMSRPDTGPVSGGTSVTITGTGFVAGATLAFGTATASSVTVVSDTSITAVTPAGTAGNVDLVVTNPDGQSGRLSRGFFYIAAPTMPAPTLTSIAPASGTTDGGTAVTLTGSGFAAGASVSIGGTPASNVAVASATSITATTPPHGAGAVDVIVTNTDGQNARLNGAFTYVALPPPIVVITIQPTGVTPKTVTISPGMRVRFINNDTVPHDMESDPHPIHTDCPPINQVGVVLPLQAKETGVFTTIRTCGYHDHNDPIPKWMGTIEIR
jgi:plastocyanin